MDEEAKKVITECYYKWLEDELKMSKEDIEDVKEISQNIIKAIKRETQAYVERLEKGMRIPFQKIKNKRYK